MLNWWSHGPLSARALWLRLCHGILEELGSCSLLLKPHIWPARAELLIVLIRTNKPVDRYSLWHRCSVKCLPKQINITPTWSPSHVTLKNKCHFKRVNPKNMGSVTGHLREDHRMLSILFQSCPPYKDIQSQALMGWVDVASHIRLRCDSCSSSLVSLSGRQTQHQAGQAFMTEIRLPDHCKSIFFVYFFKKEKCIFTPVKPKKRRVAPWSLLLDDHRFCRQCLSRSVSLPFCSQITIFNYLVLLLLN